MRPPTRAASLRQTYSESGKLRIERARYAIKRLVQSGAGGLHGNDDHNRNASSDETILDGGHARVVFQEAKKFMHGLVPRCAAPKFTRLLYGSNFSRRFTDRIQFELNPRFETHGGGP